MCFGQDLQIRDVLLGVFSCLESCSQPVALHVLDLEVGAFPFGKWIPYVRNVEETRVRQGVVVQAFLVLRDLWLRENILPEWDPASDGNLTCVVVSPGLE